jgi:hypothetical protein
MPIYVYAQDKNDVEFINIINDQIPDSVSSVDVADLNLVSIDVAATSKDDLDNWMSTEGFAYLHTATNVISGNKHWGSFTTVNEPVADVATGDTGYDTTKNEPVYYDGAAWTEYNIIAVSDISSVQIPAVNGTAKFNWLDELAVEQASFEFDDSANTVAYSSSLDFNFTAGLTQFTPTNFILELTTNDNIVFLGGPTGGDTTPMLRLLSQGSNTGNMGWYIGRRNPVGNVTAVRGHYYVRTTAGDGIYLRGGNNFSNNDEWYNISGWEVNTESTTQSLPPSYDHTRIDASAGTPVFTLPDASRTLQGKDYTFKLTSVSGTNYGELVPFAGDNFDGSVNTLRIGGLNDSIGLKRVSGSSYDIISDTRNIGSAISHTGGVIAQAGIGTTPVIITAFNNDVGSYNGILTGDAGSNIITVDHIEDSISGDQYVIIFNITYEFAASNILTLEVYYNGVATGIIAEAKGLGTSNDQLSMGAYGSLTVTTAANFEIRANNSIGSDTANWYAGSFVVKRAR